MLAKAADLLTGASSIVSDVKTLFDPKASLWDKIKAGIDGVLNVGMDVLMVMGVGEALRAADLLLRGGIDLAEHLLETDAVDTSEHVVEDAVQGCMGLSFASATLVATSKGEQAIGTMRVGEKVLAYNPTTRKMELEPVLHVWINHDNDLVDLTLTTTSKSIQHGKTTFTKSSETLHTNKKHPFLTEEKGFLPVGQITLGMHILQANRMYGVVTGWKVVPGVQVMYNLEVAQDHTYTVGSGQWVVHNSDCGGAGSFDTLPNDAYRAADKSGDLSLDLRQREINPDGTVKSGLSHTEDPSTGVLRGPFYRLPAGTQAPEGTAFVRTWSNFLKAWHVGIEPVDPMLATDYSAAVETLRSFYEFFGG